MRDLVNQFKKIIEQFHNNATNYIDLANNKNKIIEYNRSYTIYPSQIEKFVK